MPVAMPIMPIFTMGLEMLLLFSPSPEIRSAINFSMFNIQALLHKNKKLLLPTLSLFFSLLGHAQETPAIKAYSTVVTGAAQFEAYLPLLKNKRVALLTNYTGKVGNTSTVDTLIKLKVKLVKIFGPEHGFRGNVEAGEKVQTSYDKKTGLAVISLYGKNKKPSKEQLKNVDVLIYDIQDVGVRFYTYISTLTYAMEACAENNKELIVLDRPNPNGFYVDGPVLQDEYASFLGLHPVPIVYGMTTGEYAQMVNGEGWMKTKKKCRLTVIALKNYDRKASYALPDKPSPNLPNSTSILLYPGLGLFEGTIMSLGRGTEFPFQVLGHPDYPKKDFTFEPKTTCFSSGPKYFNKICYGLDLRTSNYLKQHPGKIDLSLLIQLYGEMGREDFFDANFDYHAGNKTLRYQVVAGESEQNIRLSWEAGLEVFRAIRKKYLIYQDF